MILIWRGTARLFTLLVALMGLTLPAQSIASALRGGTVSASYAAGTAALVKVEVNGHTYVFIVDTGASTSAVTSKAAAALGLVPTGPARSVTTIGCRTAVRPAEITGWRIGDVALPPSPITILNNALSSEKLGSTPVSGLLGSDVLSRFGTVTFDLAGNHLTLGGRVANRAGIPMKVVRSQGGVAEIVRATINRHSSSYVVDTGSPLTLVPASAASRSGLVALPGPIKIRGAAGCSLKAHVTQIFDWSAGGQPLPSTPALTVGSTGITLSKKGPAIGLIGAETLFSFGRLTMDFTHSRLILGSPTRASRSTPALSALIKRPWGPLGL